MAPFYHKILEQTPNHKKLNDYLAILEEQKYAPLVTYIGLSLPSYCIKGIKDPPTHSK